MHIEVKDMSVEIKKGVAARTGKAYEIHEQSGYLVTADERKKITLSLRHGQQPYAAGRYSIGDESFDVDSFGQLKIGRLHLQPATPAQRAG